MKVTRDDVKEILIKWGNGELKTIEIQAWASDRYASKDYVLADWEGKNKDKSVINEVLACLDCLALNVIDKEDVPALLELLDTPIGNFEDGIFSWENYLLAIDLEERRSKIDSNPEFKRIVNY